MVREALETNLLGAWRTTIGAAAAVCSAARTRAIVNVSSGSGQLADMGGGTPAYRVSKTALNALTRMLAAELPRGPGELGLSGLGRHRHGRRRRAPGGARAPASVMWAVDLPDDGPTGGFFRDGRPLPG